MKTLTFGLLLMGIGLVVGPSPANADTFTLLDTQPSSSCFIGNGPDGLTGPSGAISGGILVQLYPDQNCNSPQGRKLPVTLLGRASRPDPMNLGAILTDNYTLIHNKGGFLGVKSPKAPSVTNAEPLGPWLGALKLTLKTSMPNWEAEFTVEQDNVGPDGIQFFYYDGQTGSLLLKGWLDFTKHTFTQTGCRGLNQNCFVKATADLHINGGSIDYLYDTVSTVELKFDFGGNERLAKILNTYKIISGKDLIGDIILSSPSPAPDVVDTDGDGIPDSEDHCPFDFDPTNPSECPVPPQPA